MKYGFKDIDNKTVCQSNLLFVVGNNQIFVNLITDRIRKEHKHTDTNIDALDEFMVTGESNTNSVGFDEFMECVYQPCVNGKWLCIERLDNLSKRQIEKLDKYKDSTSNYGVLVITSTDYKQFRKYLFDRTLTTKDKAHIIQVSYPNKQKLIEITREIFMSQYKLQVDKDALSLFVLRLSNQYDDYTTVIETNILPNHDKNLIIGRREMTQYLKGVNNYLYDDFVSQITKKVSSDKFVKSRTVYKMYLNMIEEYSPRTLVNKLLYSINDLIIVRELINRGIIPIGVRYSITDIRKRLKKEDNTIIDNITDFRLNKLIETASQTTLHDLVSIKAILLTADKTDETTYDRVMNAVIHRNVYSNKRLQNIIGLFDTIQEKERNDDIQFNFNRYI